MNNFRKSIAFGLTALACGMLSAAETPARDETPVAVAVLPSLQYPSTAQDVLGLRFGLLASEHRNVSLLDINLLAALTTGEELGLQLSGIYNRIGSGVGVLQLGGLANDCRRDFTGGQVSAFYNRTEGAFWGLAVGALNMSADLNGIQVGLVNRCKVLEGLQVGVVNYAEEAEGLQVGVVNVMRDGKWPVLPLINFGF